MMEVDGDVVSVDRGCGRTRPRRWYALHVDSGEKPSPRVGHTATAVPHRAQVSIKSIDYSRIETLDF